MISEYLLRGAGGLDSRQFSDAMDRLGGRRSITSDTYFMRVSLTLAGEQLAEGLALLVSLIRASHFEPDAFAAVQSLCLQELQGLEDDPSQLSVIRLDEIRLPPPFHSPWSRSGIASSPGNRRIPFGALSFACAARRIDSRGERGR